MSNNTFHNIRASSLPTVANATDRLAFIPPNDGYTLVQLDTEDIYTWNATTQVWKFQSGTPGAITTVGTLDGNVASADAASISGNSIFMQSASDTAPGVVNITTQTLKGNKTIDGTIAASNLSGTNTGNVTLGAVGIVPSANAASLSGQVLTLQPFDGTHPGVVTASGGGTANFARADGTWAAPAGTAGITALTGDGTATGPGSVALTLATVNANTGSFGGSTAIPSFTVNGKGLITAASTNVVIAPAGTLTGATLASGVTASALTSLGTQVQNLNMGSNKIVSVTDPTSGQDAATKSYVDTALAALNPAQAAYAASTANIAGTYLNGVAGIGATFTTTATGAFTIDGVTPPLSARILFKDQTSGFQNGVYNLTTLGSLGISAIFTRSLDYNTAADMNTGGLIPVINGTVNALSSWQQIATITTVGTDSLVFSEFTANPSLYLLKANNLSDVASKTTSYANLQPTGDIVSTTWSGIANNTANQTITGLLFSNTVSSFDVLVNIQIVASANTYTTVKLIGTRRAASDWSTASIQTEYVGDAITGLLFDINSSGQVLITTGSIAGFVSGVTKFRAITLS